MKTRIQVTLNPLLVAQARKLMESSGFDSFSEYLEHLIREEWKRQQAATFCGDVPPLPRPELNDPKPITYRKTKEEGYEYYGIECVDGHGAQFGQKKEGGFFYKKDEWKTYEERTQGSHGPQGHKETDDHEDIGF